MLDGGKTGHFGANFRQKACALEIPNPLIKKPEKVVESAGFDSSLPPPYRDPNCCQTAKEWNKPLRGNV